MLLIFSSQISSAQSCEDPRTPAIVAYLQYTGAGWELGWWPEGSPLGVFGGMNIQKQFIQDPGKETFKEMFGTQVYTKLQLRLFERVALTGTAGLLNGQDFFYAGGIRFNYPLNETTAIIGEPQLGNMGFNLQLGVGWKF